MNKPNMSDPDFLTEIKGTLNRDMEKWIKENMPRKPEIMPRVFDFKTYMRWEAKMSQELAIGKDIKKINSIFKTNLAKYQDTQQALETIFELKKTSQEEYKTTDSVVLRRVLSEIDKNFGSESEWKRIFMLRGVKVLWVVGRNLFPEIDAVEKLLKGIEEKDYKIIAVGIVRVVAPRLSKIYDCASWLLKETNQKES